MNNVKVKEITVSNIEKFLTTIRDVLLQCQDTQIFISNVSFERILQDSYNSIIWEENVLDSLHYLYKIERAFIFRIKDSDQSQIFQIHIVQKCLNFVHVTYFACEDIIYQNYYRKMKVILIINTD